MYNTLLQTINARTNSKSNAILRSTHVYQTSGLGNLSSPEKMESLKPPQANLQIFTESLSQPLYARRNADPLYSLIFKIGLKNDSHYFFFLTFCQKYAEYKSVLGALYGSAGYKPSFVHKSSVIFGRREA